MPVAIAIHHPRPEHRDEWLEIMRQAGQASANLPGLIGPIAGYREADGARLVGVSHWESMDALRAGIAGIKQQSQQADHAWGRQPTDVLVLSEL
ncbi:MAG TPA: antibiotic biosynthesis monooxygenase [Conexibacter sp.]|jgi:heme-degrading monooxygenase HmoA|nr:antibiotic biosynthesis monooxygenase [Conexibacter sp.]